MSEEDAPDDSPAEVAVSLVERYLERHQQELSANRNRSVRDRIQRWENRREELDEDDPLYDIVSERIREQKEELDSSETNSEELVTRLLEVVADGFLAEGKWLDPSIRALSLILFDKYSDSLVVSRHVIDEHAEFGDEELYSVSRAVRDLAAEHLESGVEGWIVSGQTDMMVRR